MKKYKISYWISTGLFSAFMIFSGYSYLTTPEMREAFASLGFTEDYFRVELGVAKILGSLALIFPFTPKVLKFFAYAGFAINLVSAIIAHLVTGYNSYTALIFSVIALAISYYSFTVLQNQKQNVRV